MVDNNLRQQIYSIISQIRIREGYMDESYIDAATDEIIKLVNLGERSEPPHPLLGDVTPLSVSCKTCRYDIYPHDTGECSGSLCMNYSSYEPVNKVLTDEERDEHYKKMHQQWLENATGKA